MMSNAKMAIGAVLSVVVSSPVSATLFVFDLNGPASSIFELESDSLPDYSEAGQGFIYNNVPGVFENSIFDEAVQLSFSSGMNGGGLEFSFIDTEFVLQTVSLSGPMLYSGLESNPSFFTGRFNLLDRNMDAYTLQISSAAVPESDTLLLFLLGIMGVGAVRQFGSMNERWFLAR